MRHNKTGRRLGRNSSHRKAMMRNMVTSLLDHEKITTTDARAKELRKIAEKLITLGKRGDLHARRQAMQIVFDKQVVGKLFERIAPRYIDRPGGYTRIIKLGNRQGDNAPTVVIELVEEEFTPKTKKAKPLVEAAAAPVDEIVEETTEDVAEEAAEETTEDVAEEAAEEVTETVAEETPAKEEKKED